MPQIDRSVANVPVTPKRKSRRHTFGGSLIPKSEELRKDTQRMRAFHEDGLTLEWIDAPASIVRGTRVTLKFAASNARAGHRLPAGDLERHLLLDFELKSNDGRVLASKQEYIGVKYEWRAPTKLSDTRLARGERREYEVEFTPSEAGAFTLSLRASKWRLDPKSLADRGTSTRVVAGIPFLSLERPIDVTDS